MSTIFQGCGTALLTPFKNGEVDYEAFAATVDWQVEAGIDFLVPLGTTGETPTLTESEKLQVLEVCLQHAKGRPVVAGVGSNSVKATLDNMRLLQDADAFLVVVPFYNKPPQRGMYEYFKTIAGSTDKPVILYNVPGRTGSNLEAKTTPGPGPGREEHRGHQGGFRQFQPDQRDPGRPSGRFQRA